MQRCLGDKDTRYASVHELHQDLLTLKRRIEPTLRPTLATATTIGLEPTRTTNQDAWGYLTGQLTAEGDRQTWAVACVADGMGGMAAGDLASEVAVKTVLAEAGVTFTQSEKITAEAQVQWLKQWTHRANQKVCDLMETRQERGGCTLISMSLVHNRLAIAHVGDCRFYRLHQQELTLLTRDHSLAMAFLLQGEIQPEDIRHHPDRSKVTRSLGDRQPMPDYFVDTLEQVTGQSVLEMVSGDVLLLCSDGVWEPVLEAEIAEILVQSSSLEKAASTLIQTVLQRGAPDNATVILLRLDEVVMPMEG